MCRAAAIPRAKGGVRFEMKLVYNHWAPLFLFLLQWIDSSCACLLPRYLNFFHILVYKVGSSSLVYKCIMIVGKDFTFFVIEFEYALLDIGIHRWQAQHFKPWKEGNYKGFLLYVKFPVLQFVNKTSSSLFCFSKLILTLFV